MPKIHIFDKHRGRQYCGNNSAYSAPTFAKALSEATCKVCRGLYLVDKGKIQHMPFGGDLDKNGKLRKNVGRLIREDEEIDSAF